MSSSKQLYVDVVKQDGGLAVIELKRYDGKSWRDDPFYVVEIHRANGQVLSIVPNDSPRDRTRACGSFTPGGVMTVANPRTRSNAMRWFSKLKKEAAAMRGDY